MHREIFSVCYRLFEAHKKILMNHRDFCIEAIIFTFDKSPNYYEMKVWLLEKFLKKMNYQQIDRLLTVIEEKFICIPFQSLIVNNLNPVLTLLVLLDNLVKIKDLYNMTEFRCDYLID